MSGGGAGTLPWANGTLAQIISQWEQNTLGKVDLLPSGRCRGWGLGREKVLFLPHRLFHPVKAWIGGRDGPGHLPVSALLTTGRALARSPSVLWLPLPFGKMAPRMPALRSWIFNHLFCIEGLIQGSTPGLRPSKFSSKKQHCDKLLTLFQSPHQFQVVICYVSAA